MSDDSQPPTPHEKRRLGTPHSEVLETEGTLRERMPRYLRAFGLGLVAIAVIAGLMVILSSTSFDTAFGSAAVFAGTSLLLVGGLSGGGYSNVGFGAAEALLGRRRRFDGDPVREANAQTHDPMARLRRGLRPPPNPKAFWQIIAGCLYIALGIPFTF